MRCRHLVVSLAVLALGLPGSAKAQAVVSFDVPVNLTQVHPDIQRVRVVCAVMSEAIVPAPIGTQSGWSNLIPSTSFSWTSEILLPNAARQELFVFGGQVAATVRVIVTIPAEWLVNPIGKKAMYGCMITGFSGTAQKWDFFSEQSTDPVFRLKVVPAEGYQGEFIW